MNTSFLYIMQTDFYFKVGITSTSLKNRIKQVQTGCPTPIRNIYFYAYQTRSQAMNSEKILHESFKSYNTYGEWFIEFPKYINISCEILGIKLEKIELSVNKEMTDYYARYIRKIKSATTILELENLYNSVMETKDEYFIGDQKISIIRKIKKRSGEIATTKEKIIIDNTEYKSIINNSTLTGEIKYSEIVALSKQLKKIRKSRI